MAFDLKSIVVGPITTLIVSVRQTFDTAIHITEVLRETVDDAITIYNEIREFDLKPNWKIRVTSPQATIDQAKALAQAPYRIFVALRDLVRRVKASVDQFRSPLAEAESAAAEAGSLEGSLLRIFPRLANLLGKAITRILAVAGLILQIVIDIDNAIADVHTIVGNLKTIIQGLNHLDVAFLKQTNPRRTIELADGTTMKIRVGNLHS